MRIYIVHGSFGNPQENWFPWLKKELERLGYEVVVPIFPTPENQSLDSWRKVFFEENPNISSNSIFVGHSLGPAFILNILENHKAKAAFFVSPFINYLGNDNFDKVNHTFYKEFNWEKIKENCKLFFLFHSNNDPYVPIGKAQEVADHLGTEITIVEGAGHFNESAGYKEFPLLLKKIKEVLKS